MKFLRNSSSGMVLLISCIMCMITMAMSDLCPPETRDTCKNVASGLNCVLCIVVIAHMFGMFKK